MVFRTMILSRRSLVLSLQVEESRELQVTAVCDDLYDLCQHACEKLADPETRKRVVGRTPELNWEAVHAFLVSKSGRIRPGWIERYGVSRVFDMICTETQKRKRRRLFDYRIL